MKHSKKREAKTDFSALIQDIQNGEEIFLVKAGVPFARLAPIGTNPQKRELGYDEGLPFRIDPDFDTFVP
jgi:antitoxin (DNA-binding transcriptional repressor) of toxin-antitoxin stability system